jgi:hypothetical protein
MQYKRVGPDHQFKEGDRVIDLMFPEYGPATLEQHPCPEWASNGRNKRDKWIVRYDDKSKPVFWVAKNGDWSAFGILSHGG